VNHKVWELFYLLIIIDKENYNELCDYVPPNQILPYDMLKSNPTCQKKLVNKVLVNKKNNKLPSEKRTQHLAFQVKH
jgi:hypothetical protein